MLTRCPFCEGEGERSKVYPSPYSSSTCMMFDQYYDEDGKHHLHDPNSTTREYSCSRGHAWTVTTVAGCAACGKGDTFTVAKRQMTIDDGGCVTWMGYATEPDPFESPSPSAAPMHGGRLVKRVGWKSVGDRAWEHDWATAEFWPNDAEEA